MNVFEKFCQIGIERFGVKRRKRGRMAGRDAPEGFAWMRTFSGGLETPASASPGLLRPRFGSGYPVPRYESLESSGFSERLHRRAPSEKTAQLWRNPSICRIRFFLLGWFGFALSEAFSDSIDLDPASCEFAKWFGLASSEAFSDLAGGLLRAAAWLVCCFVLARFGVCRALFGVAALVLLRRCFGLSLCFGQRRSFDLVALVMDGAEG